jgi:myo-inositol-1-phosphate synthase
VRVLVRGEHESHLGLIPIQHIRKDIRDFKAKHALDRVVVIWTANTERFVDVSKQLNGTADNVLASIKNNHPEVCIWG